jgi:hypothetical protein
MRSVFSGTESLGVKPPLTLVSSSGGGASLPTEGISFAMVEVVLVKWGLRGFSIWNLRYCSEVSLVRLLRCSNWFVRAAEMLKERHAELCSAAKARDERTTILEEAMAVLVVN